MLGYYNYTVILTYMGTLAGFLGIAYISNGNMKMALLCLIYAGICDMFDGKIASTMKRTAQEKKFGIQIDSLSDLICFGALPALIVFRCGGGGAVVHLLIGAGYLLCALIRLAWFNVDEEERQNTSDGARDAYRGLPVTASALILPLFLGGGLLFGAPLHIIAPCLALCMAVAFLTPFRIKKPKLAGKVVLIGFGFMELVIVLLGGVRA